MLEKQKGVTVAMPFCAIGTVEIWTSKPGALTEQQAREVVEDHPKFELLNFARQAPSTKAKGADQGTEKGTDKGAEKGGVKDKQRGRKIL